MRNLSSRERAWPLHDDCLPDAALVQAPLLSSEKSGVVEELEARAVRAIVARKNHQRLLGDVERVQMVEHGPDHHILRPDRRSKQLLRIRPELALHLRELGVKGEWHRVGVGVKLGLGARAVQEARVRSGRGEV